MNEIKIHNLKIDDEFFREIESGKKTFEIRFNDRDYRAGDIITIQSNLTGEIFGPIEIKYILFGTTGRYGLKPGFCVFNW